MFLSLLFNFFTGGDWDAELTEMVQVFSAVISFSSHWSVSTPLGGCVGTLLSCFIWSERCTINVIHSTSLLKNQLAISLVIALEFHLKGVLFLCQVLDQSVERLPHLIHFTCQKSYSCIKSGLYFDQTLAYFISSLLKILLKLSSWNNLTFN